MPLTAGEFSEKEYLHQNGVEEYMLYICVDVYVVYVALRGSGGCPGGDVGVLIKS